MKNKVLIVAHDAGGAEIISAWVRKNQYNYTYVLTGPAVKIFTGKLLNIVNYPVEKLVELINDSDWVITGTGWSTDLEKMAIKLSLQLNKKVISYLDHWCEYSQRFIYEGKLLLPDEIWVGDEMGWKLALDIFPLNKLKYVQNEFFIDVQQEFIEKKMLVELKEKNTQINLIYLCEPIAEQAALDYGDSNYWGATEYDLFTLFLQHAESLINAGKIAEIKVRLHPAEQINKYADIINKYSHLPLHIDNNNSLIDSYLWADWIVGCSSMALVIGLMLNKRVFRCIPSDTRLWRLPHPQVMDFIKSN